MRKIIALAAAIATLAIAMQPGSSHAAGVQRAAGSKMCFAANTVTGKRMSWRCTTSQKCCYDALFNTGSCAPASSYCL